MIHLEGFKVKMILPTIPVLAASFGRGDAGNERAGADLQPEIVGDTAHCFDDEGDVIVQIDAQFFSSNPDVVTVDGACEPRLFQFFRDGGDIEISERF